MAWSWIKDREYTAAYMPIWFQNTYLKLEAVMFCLWGIPNQDTREWMGEVSDHVRLRFGFDEERLKTRSSFQSKSWKKKKGNLTAQKSCRILLFCLEHCQVYVDCHALGTLECPIWFPRVLCWADKWDQRRLLLCSGPSRYGGGG